MPSNKVSSQKVNNLYEVGQDILKRIVKDFFNLCKEDVCLKNIMKNILCDAIVTKPHTTQSNTISLKKYQKVKLVIKQMKLSVPPK